MLVLLFLVALPLLFAAPARRSLAIHLTNPTTGDCDALVEETPWKISNITMFDASPGPNPVSYFFFYFIDTNKGLEMQTLCQYYQILEGNATLINGDEYHLCMNGEVAFRFDGYVLKIDRFYKDPCLGEAPYDNAFAHGQANLTLKKSSASDGVMSTQTEVFIPITSLS